MEKSITLTWSLTIKQHHSTYCCSETWVTVPLPPQSPPPPHNPALPPIPHPCTYISETLSKLINCDFLPFSTVWCFIVCFKIWQTMTRTPFLLLTFLQLSTAYHMGFYIPLIDGRENDVNSGRAYAHALTIAIDDVNNDPSILPGHNLTYSWTNSTDSSEVLRSMYQKYISPLNVTCGAQPTPNTPVDVFIGPADSCTAPAKVAQAFNIPMISYVSIYLTIKLNLYRTTLSEWVERAGVGASR
jgi:hypothetical protein